MDSEIGYARDSIDVGAASGPGVHTGAGGRDVDPADDTGFNPGTGVDSAAARSGQVPAIPREAEGRDTDTDGRVDEWSVDRDGDGNPELVLRDDNYDGDDAPDQVLYDVDDNGVVELDAVDADGDGRLDVWSYDRDQDGRIDMVITDQNGDGVPDGGWSDDNYDGVADRAF